MDKHADGMKRSNRDKQHRVEAAIHALIGRIQSKTLSESEKAALWVRIQRHAAPMPDKRHSNLKKAGWIVAASLLAGIGIVFFLSDNDRAEQQLLSRTIAASGQAMGDSISGITIGENALIPLTNDSKLVFEGNRVMTEDKDGTANQFALGEAGEATTITVPYGKRSEIQLPDGSLVWLNAGSALTFPNRFSGEKREVFLSGEAFFEVVHQQSHTPFFVYTGQLQVKVLGTSFNISAYEDDEETGAFLVEGRIELSPLGDSGFKKQILEKGVAATLNKKQGHLAIAQKGVDEHIAWTRKQLALNSTPFPTILKKLERLYNIEIDLPANDPLVDERFSGVLDLEQPAVILLKNMLEGNQYATKQKGRRINIIKQ